MRNIIIVSLRAPAIGFVVRVAGRIERALPQRIRKIVDVKEDESLDPCRAYVDSQNGGVAIFLSHGSDDSIGRPPHEDLVRYPNSHNILRHLSVVAIACSSARILGRGVVADGTVRVFFGFDADISWKGLNQQKFKTHLGAVLTEVLIRAIRERSSFEQFRRELSFTMLNSTVATFPRGPKYLERFQSLHDAIYCGGDLSESF